MLSQEPSVASAASAAPAVALALFALAASAAALDLLRGLSRDCDIKLLVSKQQWGRDVLAYRVQVHVPRVRGSRDAGGALRSTITTACFHWGLRHLGQHVVGRR